MIPGVAAGHPATAEAGLEILLEGGTAADSAVAASLASCVAETVMTGLAGGGHALWLDGESGQTSLLDFFVAFPGLGRAPRAPELIELGVPFGAELVHHEHTALCVSEVLHDVPSQVVADGIGVPVGVIEEVLHSSWPRFADGFGHLPGVLAPNVA